MNYIIQNIWRNRYFLLFIWLFTYVQSIYTRIIVNKQINAYTFTPDAALGLLINAGFLFLILLLIIKKWNKSDVLSPKVLFKIFGASLFLYVLIINILELLIAFLFGNIARNFNQETFTLALCAKFLNGLIYGGFFLAYYYYLNHKKTAEKIATYNKAMTDSKINQLKAQLNPHFLFNNLNVLDQLIAENKNKASDFLNDFADIYRYVLQSSDKELIRMEDEIAFVKQYFKLIQYKYHNAYKLQIESKSVEGFIVPMTLQLLVENAIKHNLGSEKEPIFVQIKINQRIRVSNNINLKQYNKNTSERALKNLIEQYGLLSKKVIVIQQTENNFLVEIPIIY